MDFCGELLWVLCSLLYPVCSIQSVFILFELCSGCDIKKGEERNQMLWKTKVVWSIAVASSSCNNRVVSFQNLISQRICIKFFSPEVKRDFSNEMGQLDLWSLLGKGVLLSTWTCLWNMCPWSVLTSNTGTKINNSDYRIILCFSVFYCITSSKADTLHRRQFRLMM